MNRQEDETFAEPISRLEVIGQLRAQLVDVLPDAETLWHLQPEGPSTRRKREVTDGSFAFRGHLAMDSSEAYALLRERFAALGYTPLFRQQGGYDIVIAIRRVFGSSTAHSGARQWLPNLILLLITVVTTTLMGALYERGDVILQDPSIVLQRPWILLAGIPASFTIMSILGVHELAHYFAARKHGLETSLPYFIPVPFGFGTFGAIIRIRTPWENRKALFDVGLAGPLAGLMVALPLFFIGLLNSPAQLPIPEGSPLGSPLLLRWIEDWVYAVRGIPPNHEIYVNAMTFAAWFGLVVTGFNLLPAGQLDGGHVAAAVLGRWARVLGSAVLVGLVILGTVIWNGWFTWAVFIFLSGWRHPAPLNALEPLGWKRQVIGILAFILIILLFTPSPFPA